MSSGEETGERNPFAPPAEDAPEQPWRPRPQQPAQWPQQQSPQRPRAQHPSGDEPGSGDPGAGGPGTGGPGTGDQADDEPGQVPPPHPWSPGYRGGWSAPQPPRFDPTDPVQRRSRQALSAGMAGLFCALTSLPYLALLFGLLALYWALSALRAGRPRRRSGPWTAGDTRPQTPAALGGLLTGGVALLFAFSSLGLQVYYQDYLTCVNDALTTEAVGSCNHLAPNFIVQLANTDAG